jgi:hypothetical protein
VRTVAVPIDREIYIDADFLIQPIVHSRTEKRSNSPAAGSWRAGERGLSIAKQDVELKSLPQGVFAGILSSTVSECAARQ